MQDVRNALFSRQWRFRPVDILSSTVCQHYTEQFQIRLPRVKSLAVHHSSLSEKFDITCEFCDSQIVAE